MQDANYVLVLLLVKCREIFQKNTLWIKLILRLDVILMLRDSTIKETG